MKKIVLILLNINIVFIVLLYLYSNQKRINLEFYSIYEAKGLVMEKDREISFDFYSYKKDVLIEDINKNEYILELDNMKIKLDVIRIDSFLVKDNLYLFKLYAKMPILSNVEYFSNKQDLVIINQNYKLTLKYGPISFLNPNSYKLLSLDSLYGSYMKIDKELALVGLNLKLHNNYSYLTKLRLGNICYSDLSKTKFDTLFDNVINLSSFGYNYNYKKYEDIYSLKIESKDLFIPLGYKELSIIRESYIIFELDLETYYFDTFKFLNNTLDILEYDNFKMKGEIEYV